MPVERKPIGVSQLCELLGVEVGRFIGIVPDPCARNTGERDSTRWWIVLEPEMQTTGTCPPLSDNTGRRKPKK